MNQSELTAKYAVYLFNKLIVHAAADKKIFHKYSIVPDGVDGIIEQIASVASVIYDVEADFREKNSDFETSNTFASEFVGSILGNTLARMKYGHSESIIKDTVEAEFQNWVKHQKNMDKT